LSHDIRRIPKGAMQMKSVLSIAVCLMAAAMIVGCGGGSQQPAKTEKPAEPAFVAQTEVVPAMKVASIAKMGPYSEVGKCMTDLMGLVQKEKLDVVGVPFGMYYDNPATVKPESTRFEVCVQVAPATPNKTDKKTGFAVKDLPEMTVATTSYMGPYEKVAPTYEKLGKWVAENKYQPAGPAMEWYLSDPSQVKPESLQAKVGWVVKPLAPVMDSTKQAEEPKKDEPKKAEPKDN